MRTPPITAKYLLGLIALVALNASAATTKKNVANEEELVAAIAEWNTGSGNYEITLAEGTYDLSKIEAMDASKGLLAVLSQKKSRSVTIRGDLSVPREKVVIDGKGLGRVFYIDMYNNTGKWTLENLTVQNGNASGSGGGLCWPNYGESALVKNCVFRDCTSVGGNGGAIYVTKNKSSGTTIEDSLLVSNKVTTTTGESAGGGAIYGVSTITRCTFIGNRCESKLSGGAVLCSKPLTITNCAFTDNKLVASGAFFGGALCSLDAATISGCVFTNNAATFNPGGAVYLAQASTVAACTFVSNTTASSSGGGVYTKVSGSTLRGCTFLGNHAGSSGGGASGAFACVSNCTFVSNVATSGGGIASCPNVIDCGFASNYAAEDEDSGGGAAYNSTLFICGITNNSANYIAGGCFKCKVFDSYLSGNTGSSAGIQGHASSHFERCEVVAKGNGSGRTFLNCSFNACTFHDCNSAYLFCRHAYVTNCLFVANKENRIFNNFASGETDNTSFFVNCTFVNNSYDYLAAYASGVPADKRATFLNCLFDGNGYINSSGGLTVETFGKGYKDDIVSNCFLYTQYSPIGANNINRKTTRQDPRLMGDRDPSRPYAPRRRSCLNGAGLVQGWMASATDLDGHPRLTDGKVAIGAYETTEPAPGMMLYLR